MRESPGAAVQASYMKNLHAALAQRDTLGPVGELDPELVGEVAAASRLRWLPVALNVRTVAGVCAVRGEERGLAELAECVHAQFDTPLWRSFVTGGLRLLGRDPGALGRWVPRAFSVVFRDCGVFAAERDGTCALGVELREIPEALLSERQWLRSLGVGLHALLILCSAQGCADLEHIDVPRRCARFRVRWKGDPRFD